MWENEGNFCHLLSLFLKVETFLSQFLWKKKISTSLHYFSFHLLKSTLTRFSHLESPSINDQEKRLNEAHKIIFMNLTRHRQGCERRWKEFLNFIWAEVSVNCASPYTRARQKCSWSNQASEISLNAVKIERLMKVWDQLGEFSGVKWWAKTFCRKLSGISLKEKKLLGAFLSFIVVFPFRLSFQI